jgi:hypothetical protein
MTWRLCKDGALQKYHLVQGFACQNTKDVVQEQFSIMKGHKTSPETGFLRGYNLE